MIYFMTTISTHCLLGFGPPILVVINLLNKIVMFTALSMSTTCIIMLQSFFSKHPLKHWTLSWPGICIISSPATRSQSVHNIQHWSGWHSLPFVHLYVSFLAVITSRYLTAYFICIWLFSTLIYRLMGICLLVIRSILVFSPNNCSPWSCIQW